MKNHCPISTGDRQEQAKHQENCANRLLGEGMDKGLVIIKKRGRILHTIWCAPKEER